MSKVGRSKVLRSEVLRSKALKSEGLNVEAPLRRNDAKGLLGCCVISIEFYVFSSSTPSGLVRGVFLTPGCTQGY